MEQFSHDLTLALEESSRCGIGERGQWGLRRRTRSTGNLPMSYAPLPTEDSSSSPPECHRSQPVGDKPEQTHSDSDEAHALRLNLKSQKMLHLQSGNFESDSFNENFSPTRPNTRRKRKFKRMAIEYETTTPSTPNMGSVGFPAFPGTKKKRILKHSCQENFKANLFFCGKRKRSHRERSIDCETREQKGHRQGYFGTKGSYLEYKTYKKYACKILPLNKSIVSKIEQISKESLNCNQFEFNSTKNGLIVNPLQNNFDNNLSKTVDVFKTPSKEQNKSILLKSGSLESPFLNYDIPHFSGHKNESKASGKCEYISKKHQFKNPYNLHYEDPNVMECSMNDFLSSSSLSSSDSEAVLTNESDREGDDELTDWPGNENMVIIAQRKSEKLKQLEKHKIKPQKSAENDLPMEEDTMMSDATVLATVSNDFEANNDLMFSPLGLQEQFQCSRTENLNENVILGSCLSGDGSMGDISSDAMNSLDVREIRAGCRRIRDERPGFSILTSANELLSRFLQDRRESALRLGPLDPVEIGKLQSLATLYSLNMSTLQGNTILTKTSNTMQAVKVEQNHMTRRFLTDYKRRCYSVPSGDSAKDVGSTDFSREQRT